jgi:hypothetical protein
MIGRICRLESGVESSMSDVFVDDASYTLMNAPRTWGDLLETLDADFSARGVLLACVRFDGVEEPAFREPSVLSRPLAAVLRVDVETATPDALLRQSLTEAGEAIAQMADEVSRISTLFRRNEPSTANAGLARLSGDLHTFVALVTTMRGPLGISEERLTIDGVSPDQQIERLAAWLESLVSAQSSEDWLTVADILEYDIEPILRAWRTRLEALTQDAGTRE